MVESDGGAREQLREYNWQNSDPDFVPHPGMMLHEPPTAAEVEKLREILQDMMQGPFVLSTGKEEMQVTLAKFGPVGEQHLQLITDIVKNHDGKVQIEITAMPDTPSPEVHPVQGINPQDSAFYGVRFQHFHICRHWYEYDNRPIPAPIPAPAVTEVRVRAGRCPSCIEESILRNAEVFREAYREMPGNSQPIAGSE